MQSRRRKFNVGEVIVLNNLPARWEEEEIQRRWSYCSYHATCLVVVEHHNHPLAPRAQPAQRRDLRVRIGQAGDRLGVGA